MKDQGGRKIEPKGKKSEVNNTQEGKEQDPVRPLCAGWPVGKVLSFHDSSIKSRSLNALQSSTAPQIVAGQVSSDLTGPFLSLL